MVPPGCDVDGDDSEVCGVAISGVEVRPDISLIVP